jgi:hypothetical protein
VYGAHPVHRHHLRRVFHAWAFFCVQVKFFLNSFGVLFHPPVFRFILFRLARTEGLMQPAVPLSNFSARLYVLRALCAVAEGADLAAPAGVADVLCDSARFCVFGGRDGLPRSLGSVHACFVLLFLGSTFRNTEQWRVPADSYYASMAVSRDGSVVVVSELDGLKLALKVVRVSDGVILHRLPAFNYGVLHIRRPWGMWVSRDDLVYVANLRTHRIQVLTLCLDVYGPSFGEHEYLDYPSGISGSDEHIAVAEYYEGAVKVFCRRDGTLQRCISIIEPVLNKRPIALCFVPENNRIVVVVWGSVLIFTATGQYVGELGADVLRDPMAVACSDSFNEIVVADCQRGICVFSSSGDLLRTFPHRACSVALHSGTGAVIAQILLDNPAPFLEMATLRLN